jgi:glutamyl-tRNA synthetase
MPDGRFAPSPTGDLHLGNLRTALLAWLFARSTGSRFLLRMEDLDTASVRAPYYDRQADDLRALGLVWDGAITRQSERVHLYRDAIEQLRREGHTYPCYCTRREIQDAVTAPHGEAPAGAYPGTCRTLSEAQRRERERSGRPPALRVRGGDARIRFTDRLHGLYEGLVDDVVVERNDGTPAYNLAVIVDDAAQGVGEVVRGDDLLSSTPRQLHLASLLGLEAPTYAHVPLVLGPDGARLAKRHGGVTLDDRRARGASTDDVLTLLARSLGLVPAGRAVSRDDLDELAASFDPARLPRRPWVLDDELLRPA